MDSSYLLAIDQGTSSTKTVLINQAGKWLARASEPLASYCPQVGFVEQEPEEIYENVRASVKQCLQLFEAKKPGALGQIRGIGISNQRETFLLWDENGVPLSKAIVWQCKRSVELCTRLGKIAGLDAAIREKTGLIIDPYFSGSKLLWLLENDENIQRAVAAGSAHFGTIDTWLLYKFTNGKVFATDYTNASRTLLFNIHTLQWDADLLQRFGLTKLRLPSVHPSAFNFGATDLNGLLPVPIPVAAMIGDSHAAAFGEGCFSRGTAKATLGTGCSILWNTGRQPVYSQHGMLTTICWSMPGRVDYALEGAIVSCGASIEWLKNQLGLFSDSSETEAIARSVADNNGVYLIPAFSGLGAPHWQMGRKASIQGLTFASDRRHIIRAALESIPFQIKDVIACMEAESQTHLKELKADGGIANNSFVMQLLADLLQTQITTIGISDVSALGAAYLAGLETSIFNDLQELTELKHSSNHFLPGDAAAVSRAGLHYEGWKSALETVKE